MFRLPGKQLQRMRQEIDDGFQRFHRACRTAREIQDEARTANPAHPAAERRKASLAQTFGAHHFRDAFNQAVTHSTGGLGCNVTRSNSCPACSNDQARSAAQMNQLFLNFALLVGREPALNYSKAALLQRFSDRRTGEVRLLAV